MKNIHKTSLFFSFLALLCVLGDMAQDSLVSTHYEMGIDECGSKDNIAYYDDKTYRCKNNVG